MSTVMHTDRLRGTLPRTVQQYEVLIKVIAFEESLSSWFHNMSLRVLLLNSVVKVS